MAFCPRFGLKTEMGAAFLSAIAGIANEHTDRNTTAYIQNWIARLEEDNRVIVHAAANAQRADVARCCSQENFSVRKRTISASISL